jgi:hypothetical protein
MLAPASFARSVPPSSGKVKFRTGGRGPAFFMTRRDALMDQGPIEALTADA